MNIQLPSWERISEQHDQLTLPLVREAGNVKYGKMIEPTREGEAPAEPWQEQRLQKQPEA
jgi:hypothetical protein